MPREEDEFALSYYNSMTTWIDIDKLLAAFGADARAIWPIEDESRGRHPRSWPRACPPTSRSRTSRNAGATARRISIPVAQFEKLWGDMTALPASATARFVVVPRLRGQQLKDQAQLDGWLRDGSAAYVESLCEWE